MRHQICTVLFIASTIFFSPGAAEARLRVLYSFQGGTDGANPEGGVINYHTNGAFLAGTTTGGGLYGVGTVFTIAPDGEHVLHTFKGGDADGAYPIDRLVTDTGGNLYGATIEGGGTGCGGVGCGTIFKISSAGVETVLYKFKGGDSDGAYPSGGLVLDWANNLYGATVYGEGVGCLLNQGCGTIFELAPDGTESILYVFKGKADGGNPQSIVRDKKGRLFGTTMFAGGAGNDGVLFRVRPGGREQAIYTFTNDGVSPSGMARDRAGDLYTSVQGGKHGYGAVFRLDENGAGGFLYSFKGGRDGFDSFGALVLDSLGNVYGTTEYGGASGCNIGCGTIFKIAPDGTQSVLHRFNRGDRGTTPVAGLIADRKGHLYGTTYSGGLYGLGTVFRLK